MKTKNEKLKNFTVSRRLKLMGLWTTLMLLYVYCDIYSFHRPGYVNEMIAGMIGPFSVSQEVLAAFSVLMAVPALMISACLLLRTGIAKWLCIIVGALYMLVNLGNLIGETWAYYWIYGILEIAVTIGIIIIAAKWDKEGNVNEKS
jgi:hypothetical protein